MEFMLLFKTNRTVLIRAVWREYRVERIRQEGRLWEVNYRTSKCLALSLANPSTRPPPTPKPWPSPRRRWSTAPTQNWYQDKEVTTQVYTTSQTKAISTQVETTISSLMPLEVDKVLWWNLSMTDRLRRLVIIRLQVNILPRLPNL